MFYFLSCNLENSELLAAKISLINQGSKEGDIIKPQRIREVNALNNVDRKVFGDWLINLQGQPKRSIVSGKLQELKIQCLARWHVMQSPDSLIPSDRSMSYLCLTEPY